MIWKEFELVQSKMFDMGFHLSEVEEWDEGRRHENYFSF